jgi:Arm DNA-binding domain
VIFRSAGRQKRVTIGTYPAISLAEARGEARRVIRDAQLGVLSNPQQSPALTLGDMVRSLFSLRETPERGWHESERASGQVPVPSRQAAHTNRPQPCSACAGSNCRCLRRHNLHEVVRRRCTEHHFHRSVFLVASREVKGPLRRLVGPGATSPLLCLEAMGCRVTGGTSIHRSG